ncbi:hypothetical protein KI387_038481, partial [Taxus chinensis]
MWVVGMDDVSKIGSKVGLKNWEADGFSMEEVCVVEVVVELVSGGVGEEVVVVEVDALI